MTSTEFVVLIAALGIFVLTIALALYIMARAFQLVISLALVARQNLGVFAESDIARDAERSRLMGAIARPRRPNQEPAAGPDTPPPAPAWADMDDDAILRAVQAGRPVASTGDIHIPGLDTPPPASGNQGEAWVPQFDGDVDTEPVPGGGGGIYANGVP